MAASYAFERLRDTLVRSVIPAYESIGSLAFVYAHGSLIEGLADDADLDLVLVWDESPPQAPAALSLSIADPEPEAIAFDQPNFRVDRFFVRGQQIDAKHVTVGGVDAWREAVERGGGMSGYPMPAIAIHGLTSGVVLRDPRGVGSTYQASLAVLPEAFRAAAAQRAVSSADSYFEELDRCAARGDGLLFHDQLVAFVRLLFIAWFARRGEWWPHEKRLSERLRRAGQEELAQLEERVWQGDMSERLARARSLASALIGPSQ